MKVSTSVVQIYHLFKYACQVRVGYNFFFNFIFSKSIYPNRMHTQKHISFKIYIHFIALDISHKYSYLQSSMFSNLDKFCYDKSHLDLKIVVDVMCNRCAMCSIVRKSVSLYDLEM